MSSEPHFYGGGAIGIQVFGENLNGIVSEILWSLAIAYGKVSFVVVYGKRNGAVLLHDDVVSIDISAVGVVVHVSHCRFIVISGAALGIIEGDVLHGSLSHKIVHLGHVIVKEEAAGGVEHMFRFIVFPDVAQYQFAEFLLHVQQQE